MSDRARARADRRTATVAQRVAVAKSALAADPAADVALTLIKADDEQRVTIGVAYPAMKTDVAVAKDGHVDFAGPEALERAAHDWLAERRTIGLAHADGSEGRGTVVESHIHRGVDLVFKAADGSEQIVREGDWVVAIRWEPATWSLIKSGRIRGYSPQGRARRSTPSAERLAELRS